MTEHQAPQQRRGSASLRSASPPLMEVRDLAVEFRVKRSVTRAVDGVSFDWRKGEILGVVGESGRGAISARKREPLNTP